MMRCMCFLVTAVSKAEGRGGRQREREVGSNNNNSWKTRANDIG